MMMTCFVKTKKEENKILYPIVTLFMNYEVRSTQSVLLAEEARNQEENRKFH